MSISKYHVSKNLIDTIPVTSGSMASMNYENANNSRSIRCYGTSEAYTQRASTRGYTLPAGTYTLSFVSTRNDTRFYVQLRSSAGTTTYASTLDSPTFTLNETTEVYARVCCNPTMANPYTTDEVISIMLNTGSTALPYEPYGDSFKDWYYRKYGTETDTITTLPAPIIGDGTALSSWEIDGNMSQTGTPSSSSPIFPSECGERTENLFDDHNVITISGLGDRYGVELPSGTYSVYNATDNIVYYGTNNFGDRQRACEPHSTGTFTLTNTAGTVGGVFMPLNSDSQGGCTVVEGSTPPDHYIPYGYKLPFQCGNTTTNIYLSEPIRKWGTYADTAASTGVATRKIFCKVLTGEENFSVRTGKEHTFGFAITASENVNCVCSHYTNISSSQFDVTNGIFAKNTSFAYISDLDYSNTTDFKAYLRTQYQNGTPVTIWYVLSTPTTESFTAPSIPTTGTAEQFDVTTTLKPSEVSLTYHGWHEHEDTEFT